MNMILKDNKFVQSFHKLKKAKIGNENALYLIDQGIPNLIV